MWLLLALALTQDEAEIQDGRTFVSRKYNLTFSVPGRDWGELRIKDKLEWKWVGGICEGLDSAGNVGFCLTADEADGTLAEYRAGFEKTMAGLKESKGFDKIREKKVGRRDGEWIRVEYEWKFKTITASYIIIYVARGKMHHKFCVWVEKRLWDDHEEVVNGILDSFNVAEASPKEGPGSYINKDLKIRLEAPAKDFTLRTEDFKYGWKDTLCEMVSRDSQIGGIFLHTTVAWKNEKYADWREKSWKENNKSCKRVKEKRLDRTSAEFLVVEFEIEAESNDFRYVHLYVQKGKHNFELLLWCYQTLWDDYRDLIYKVIESVEYGDGSSSSGGTDDPGPGPDIELKGQKYIHRKLGFHITAPEGWTVRKEEFTLGVDGTLIEVQDGEALYGVVGVQDTGLDVKTHADSFVGGVKKALKNSRQVDSKTTSQGWIRREVSGDSGDLTVRYSLLFAAKDGKNYFLGIWVSEDDVDKYKDKIDAFYSSLTFSGKGTGGDGKETGVASPWKGFGAGSWVKYRVVSEMSGMTTETELVYILESQDAESYTMRTDTVTGGMTIEGKPVRVPLKQKATDDGREKPKVEEGQETIQVPKGRFACAWVKTTTSRSSTQVWSSDRVPYRLVKSVGETGMVKTVMELVDFEKK